MKYLAITPARNELQFLPGLIDSLLHQSSLPARWILIDDGSTDGTTDMVRQLAQLHEWIEPVFLPDGGSRRPGGESVVMEQLDAFGWREFDYIFRVDADVSFERGHVARLLEELEREPRLGIVSGTNYEPVGGAWIMCPEPGFQAAGNCRIYRRECLQAIGRIESGLGWDTIDITRALMLGYRTRNFRDLKIFHRRPMQTANGRVQGRLNMGIAAYNAGYSPFFMAARSIRHAFAKPRMMGGALMMFGYLRQWAAGAPTLATPELTRFVRRQQLRRLIGVNSVWR